MARKYNPLPLDGFVVQHAAMSHDGRHCFIKFTNGQILTVWNYPAIDKLGYRLHDKQKKTVVEDFPIAQGEKHEV